MNELHDDSNGARSVVVVSALSSSAAATSGPGDVMVSDRQLTAVSNARVV